MQITSEDAGWCRSVAQMAFADGSFLVGWTADTLSMQCVLRQGVRKLQVSRIDLPPEATDRVFGDVMLEMELLQMGGQLSGTLAYNTGLFKESTAERVASQFQVVLSFSASWGTVTAVLS